MRDSSGAARDAHLVGYRRVSHDVLQRDYYPCVCEEPPLGRVSTNGARCGVSWVITEGDH